MKRSSFVAVMTCMTTRWPKLFDFFLLIFDYFSKDDMDEQDLHEAKIADIYRPGKGMAGLLKVSSVQDEVAYREV